MHILGCFDPNLASTLSFTYESTVALKDFLGVGHYLNIENLLIAFASLKCRLIFEKTQACVRIVWTTSFLHLNCFLFITCNLTFFHVHLVVIQYSILHVDSYTIYSLLIQQRRCNLIKYVLYTGFMTNNSLCHVTGQRHCTRSNHTWLNHTLSTVWLRFMYTKAYSGFSLATIFVRQTIPLGYAWRGCGLSGTPYRIWYRNNHFLSNPNRFQST